MFNIRSRDEVDVTDIWRKYQRGVEHHHQVALYANTDKAHRFFEGDQWHGLESGVEKLPMYNFIQPVCEHKIASVAMNNMAIHFSPMGSGQQQELAVCELLNELAAQTWELQKMERTMWAAVKEACISGDAWLYFYDGELHAQLIDNTNIYLSDEQQTDLQKQDYIIIYERRPVGEVRREALANGLSDEEAANILPDEDTARLLGDAKNEVKGVEKCSCLLYLSRREDTVFFSRATKTVVYQPETAVEGLTHYPLASMAWMRKKGSARGNGEVIQLIPNQIATNRLLARREISTKMTAFARPVYSKTMLANPDDLDRVGAPLEIIGNVQRVGDAFAYIAPAPMSTDAKTLQDELIASTRDLAGAGDAAMGNINPENASGAAIIAVRDQQAIPLNEQVALYRQFVEDIALVWYAMWGAYRTGGLVVAQDGREEVIPAEALKEMKVSIRVDVSPTNPFSKYAQEQALQNMLAGGYITFDEYVDALDDDASAPKAKLSEIIKMRRTMQQMGGMSNVQLPGGAENHQLTGVTAGGLPL